MKRWEPAVVYLGSGEYAPDMEEADDGEYVRYVGHSGAVHAAVRDTQRAMIAALYWRAGECDVLARLYGKSGNRGMVDIYLGNKLALHSAARRLEACL